uniref:CSON007794 protein n=1 Tax=Culicoides sonorensis TaxID=179676 RepID=A0A336N0T2_CULSO
MELIFKIFLINLYLFTLNQAFNSNSVATECQKELCKLPFCSCGGNDIPGNISRDQVPQMVLITFDDAVTSLNSRLYSELFNDSRLNPNGCPVSATFYINHEYTDYCEVQNLYSRGHEIASHSISHSMGKGLSYEQWVNEVVGQREILSEYANVKVEDIRGFRAPYLSVGGDRMFQMLYDYNFTYDSSMPSRESDPPSWPYTLDYKMNHDCVISPCPGKSFPGVWEIPLTMWNGGGCSMSDACRYPEDSDGVYNLILENFERHYNSSKAPFGLFYHSSWFVHSHHKEGFIKFLDKIRNMNDVYIVTNWQAIQWIQNPTPLNKLKDFKAFQCDYSNRAKCENAQSCALRHNGIRYMRTSKPCPENYPWVTKTSLKKSSRN